MHEIADMRWMRTAWLILLVAGCFGGRGGQDKPTTPRSEPVAQVAQETPEELQQLVEAIERLPGGAAETTHARVVAGLEHIAALLGASDEAAAKSIRAHAADLKGTQAGARDEATHVQQAIGVALDTLSPDRGRDPDANERDAYVVARDAQARLTGDEPLRHQLDTVGVAFRAIANLAALDRGLEPIFPRDDDGMPYAFDAARIAEHAQQASRIVTELAKERRWRPAGQHAAAALDALADLLEVAPLGLDEQDWRSLVYRVRFNAIELAREGHVSLDRSDRIRAGLLACVEALEGLEGGMQTATPVIAPLVTAARSAVEAIDGGTMFVFQRAAIQEAYRTTVDAFLAIALVIPTRAPGS